MFSPEEFTIKELLPRINGEMGGQFPIRFEKPVTIAIRLPREESSCLTAPNSNRIQLNIFRETIFPPAWRKVRSHHCPDEDKLDRRAPAHHRLQIALRSIGLRTPEA